VWSGLVQVTTARACFGLVVVNGLVVESAPYGARQSMGRPIEQVAAYWRGRGADVRALAAVPGVAVAGAPAPRQPARDAHRHQADQ
jgi:hypothetical protein